MEYTAQYSEMTTYWISIEADSHKEAVKKFREGDFDERSETYNDTYLEQVECLGFIDEESDEDRFLDVETMVVSR